MMQTWISTLMVLAAVGSASCKREMRPTSVAAVLPAEVASKLSKELLAFVEVLPADVEGFGYLELGKPVVQWLDMGPDYRGMLDDLAEMAKRRWSVDVRSLRGIGVAAMRGEALLFGELGAGASISTGDAEVMVAKLGSLSVVGKPVAVEALLASVNQQPPLLQAHRAWVQDVLGHAAGKAAFYSIAPATLVATADPSERQFLSNLEYGTATLSGGEATVHLTAKAGRVEALKKPVDEGLATLSAKMQLGLAALPTTGANAVLAILARHYGTALLSGIQVRASGDELAISLPWRAPMAPTRTAAPALSERVIAKDEWAVVQLDLGAPMMQTLIAFSDVVGAPLDRAKLTSQLLAELTKVMDVPVMDPRTATLSVGGASALVSLHAANAAAPRSAFAIAQGKLLAAGTPWGLALTSPEMGAALVDALAKPPAGMPLASSTKLAARREAFFRAVVDLERLPAIASLMVGQVPLRTVEVVATSTAIEAEVVVKPGQMAQVQQLLSLARDMTTSRTSAMYRDRQKASAMEELFAIVFFHQGQLVARVLTPTVAGDHLRFAFAMPPAHLRDMTILLSATGILGAVAIPAFTDYMKKGQAIQP